MNIHQSIGNLLNTLIISTLSMRKRCWFTLLLCTTGNPIMDSGKVRRSRKPLIFAYGRLWFLNFEFIQALRAIRSAFFLPGTHFK